MSAAWSPLQIEIPVTLEGSVVRLEPVRREHAAQFWNVAKDDLDDIFRWIPYPIRRGDDLSLIHNSETTRPDPL
jgi:hypothetical protein